MEERLRACILCGHKEKMTSYICSGCQERIQKEVVSERSRSLNREPTHAGERSFSPDDDIER